MKPLLTLCLTCLIVLPVQAARRVGEAQVRAGANGVPCFTISEHEQKRGGAPDFSAITVTTRQDKPVWRMALPRERTFPVAFSMCIPYGGRVPALPQTPAAPLKEGELYTVAIDVRPDQTAANPRRYQARFCLAQERSGRSVVQKIDAQGRQGRSPDGCRS